MSDSSPSEGIYVDTLAVFDRDTASGEPRTTTEVADALGVARRTAYKRLNTLAERGDVRTKKVGASGRVWWRPERAASDGESAGTAEGSAASESLVDVLDEAEVGVFVLNEDFEVVWVNDATERYFGIDRERVVGRDKRTLVEERIAPTVEDPTAFAETVLATYGDNTYTERFECHVTAGEDRADRWLEHRSKPIESGRYEGGRVELYYDFTEQKHSERALHETEQRFRSLVQAVEEYAIFLLDADGYVRSWNSGAEHLKGYTEDEIIGDHFSTFYTEDDREAGVPGENLAAADERGDTTDEGWRVRKDGTRFWANVTITAIRDDDGVLQGYAKVTRDMTDRRERERQIRRERNFIERILDTSPVGIAVLTPDGTITRANDRAETLFGISYDEAADAYVRPSGRRVYDADGAPLPPDERPCARAVRTGEPVYNEEVRIETPDGDYRWVSFNVTPVRDEAGTVERLIAAGEDVTALKTQARQLERQRDELKAELGEVFERIDDGFFALDDEFRFTYVNDRAEELLDISESEVVGHDIRDVVYISDVAEAAYTEALETQEPVTFEDYYDPLGMWIENRLYPSESGLSIYLRDVSEQKRREQQLERYETIVETVDDGIFVVDEHDRFTMVNEAYAELVGYDREELVGSHTSMVADEDPTTVADSIRGVLASSESEVGTYEGTLKTRSGETIEAEATVALLSGSESGGYERVGVVRDITDRKRFERTLTALHESSRELLQLESTSAVCESVLRTTTDVLGIDGAGIYLHDESELAPMAVTEYVADLFGDLPTFGPGDEAIAWRAFADRETITFDDVSETDLAYRDDTPLRSGIWIPLGDHGVLAVVSEEVGAFSQEDHTLADLLAATTEAALDRVERERQRRQHERELKAQNERLDRFASMLAHELRNPVTIGQIYSRQLPTGTDAEAVDHVTEAFDRMENMIDVMLVLARGRDAVGDPTRVRLADVAREAWDEIDTGGATLEVAADRVIQVDQTYVRHLLRNLFENSVEHGSTSSRPRADDAAGQGESAVTVTVGELPSGFYVADTGRGIPAEERDAVFEPGYTTAEGQGGTGLGLAFVRELANVYEWDWSVTESDAGGARFEFRNVD